MRTVVLLAALVVAASAKVYFEEDFSSDDWQKRWVISDWKGSEMGTWEHTSGDWFVDEAINKGLRTGENMKFHAISAKLPHSFSNRGKDLVVQFTTKNERKDYSFCAGGYIKLLPSGLDQKKFGGDSPYHIMFGPDLCGYDVSRIHAIFTDSNGKNLLKKDEIKLDYDEKNEFTHLYTLVVHPDNTFEVYFDQKEKSKGSLIDGWDFPKKSTDDPTDKKPSDWVDDKMIDDPEDQKPSNWDSIPRQIPDPDASKPDDWDSEMDGEWEHPVIDNPEWKGEWKAKRIENPAYKGEWKPRQIDNPHYKDDVYAYDDIAYVGFEVWTVNNGTIFDNIVITDDKSYADSLAEKNWKPTKEGEKDAKEAWDKTKKKDEPAKEDSPAAHEDEDEDEEKEEL